MSEEFHIDTRSVEVVLVLCSGRELAGTVMLRPATGAHAGGETLEDRLNEEGHFLPVRFPDGTRLIGRDQILYVRAPAVEWDERLESTRVAALPVGVRLELENGTQVDGSFFIALPPGRTRTLDWLDEQRRFLWLNQADGELYVRRAGVVSVEDRQPDEQGA